MQAWLIHTEMATYQTNYIGITLQTELSPGRDKFHYYICCECCMSADGPYDTTPSEQDIDSFAAEHRITCGR